MSAIKPAEIDEVLTDWLGTTHTRATGEVRIASLVPSITETLFELDLAENIIARTGFCVHPREQVRAVAKIGGTKDPDLARLRALAPTHLIVNVDENRRADVDEARAFVPHIIVTHPLTPDDNARLIGLLGAVFDRDAVASKLVRSTDAALASLDAAVQALPRERVLYLIWRKPWMTVARDTYVAATLARAGWDTLPVQASKRYPELRDDAPVWRETDRILLSTEPYAFRERDAKALAATTAKPVHLIDGEWTSWYGSRAARGLNCLAEFRRRL